MTMSFKSFKEKFGIKTDYNTYIGCVQAIKSYIRKTEITVEGKNSADLIKTLKMIYNITDEEHKTAQFSDDTQMMSERDAISFELSISTIDNFGRKSGLVMNSGSSSLAWKQQTVLN